MGLEGIHLCMFKQSASGRGYAYQETLQSSVTSVLGSWTVNWSVPRVMLEYWYAEKPWISKGCALLWGEVRALAIERN